MSYLLKASGKVLSSVALGGEQTPDENVKQLMMHSAERNLKSNGFADSYEEAELTITITACYLMCQFLEEFPPVLANVNGSILTVEPIFFEHRDQFDYCVYRWPLKSDPQFFKFFEYLEEGIFSAPTVLDRFTFIEPETGRITVKNGTKQFLINYTGCDDENATKIIKLGKKLSDHIVCWPDVPNEQKFRDFLSHIEVDDLFSRALNHHFGVLGNSEDQEGKKRVGRPSKRDAARRAYWASFPDGHRKDGKTWKQALMVVNSLMDEPIEVDTLKRAAAQKPQN